MITALTWTAAWTRPPPSPVSRLLAQPCAHAVALEAAALTAFTTDKPCTRKANQPPSDRAKERAPAIRDDGTAPGDAVTIGLASQTGLAPEAGR